MAKRKSQVRYGSELERKVKRMFEDLGYLALRSSASKGLADVVVVTDQHTLLIQCKRSRKPIQLNSLLAEENLQKLAKLRVPANTRKLLVFQQSGRSNYLKVYEHLNNQWSQVDLIGDNNETDTE